MQTLSNQKIDLHLLYVEDEEEVAQQLEKFFKRRFMRVSVAKDGKEGLEKILSLKPDIIITDIKMPYLSGLEMLKEVKKEINYLPKSIVITAFNDNKYLFESIEIGVFRYVVKPVIFSNLQEALDDCVEIVQALKQKERYESMIRGILDSQKSLILLSDGKVISHANRALLNFFGYTTLDDFLKEHTCICDFFIEDDRFFHIKKIKDEAFWIDVILSLVQSQQIVLMNDAKSISHAFSVTISHFDSEKYVVTFTDISETVAENFSLKSKVHHDKLTGAYNREYFENVINKTLLRHISNGKKSAFIMFDIDLFKKINDTFGHQKGDIVLKELVKVTSKNIREDDLLFRWGGEEFIIVIETSSIDGAMKTTEHLREAVESYNFVVNVPITCSFGVALYDGLVEQAIEMADCALYEAKRNGRNRVEMCKR